MLSVTGKNLRKQKEKLRKTQYGILPHAYLFVNHKTEKKAQGAKLWYRPETLQAGERPPPDR